MHFVVAFSTYLLNVQQFSAQSLLVNYARLVFKSLILRYSLTNYPSEVIPALRASYVGYNKLKKAHTSFTRHLLAQIGEKCSPPHGLPKSHPSVSNQTLLRFPITKHRGTPICCRGENTELLAAKLRKEQFFSGLDNFQHAHESLYNKSQSLR